MNVTVINHSLVRHKLTPVRETDCSTYKLHTLTTELARLMAYETSRDFEAEKYIISGWCGSIKGDRIRDKALTVVPILHADLGVPDDILDLIPTAKISVIGLQRDEEILKPVPYSKKLVDSMGKRPTLIIGPVLATDGSMAAIIDPLRAKDCRSVKVLVSIVASEGVKAVNETRPDVTIYAVAFDGHLDKHGYIILGLGDAGDKISGIH